MSEHTTTIDTQNESGRKTLKAYVSGLILCLILTTIPFILVAKHLLNEKYLYIVLAVCAILQLIVQVTFFLGLYAKSKRWDLMSFLFTILVVIVLVGGSLWIMWNLNYNMAR